MHLSDGHGIKPANQFKWTKFKALKVQSLQIQKQNHLRREVCHPWKKLVLAVMRRKDMIKISFSILYQFIQRKVQVADVFVACCKLFWWNDTKTGKKSLQFKKFAKKETIN